MWLSRKSRERQSWTGPIRRLGLWLFLGLVIALLVGRALWRFYAFTVPAAPAVLTLAGTVVSLDRPVAGAHVRLQGGAAFVVTDGDGRFSLPAPPNPAHV